MKFHIIHDWTPWEIIRHDTAEFPYGMLVPYKIQKRVCEKCNKYEVEISHIKVNTNSNESK